MRQIEAFDILTNSIRKYLHEAQANGSRNRLLQIISPCDPLNLQPLISEFDQLQNSTPRLEKLFERTTEILDTWNTFVQLPKDGESLCYRIDESCKIWLKSAGIDPEQWSEGSDYLIYTWDSTAHIINEVNGYLRRKIRPGAVPQAKENKLINNISSYIERAIKATIQTFTETFSYRPDETALRLFLKQEIKYLKAQEIDFKNKCETDQCEAARREIQEYFNKCNDQMQRIELDINACVTNAKPQNMVNDYARYCLYSSFHKDLLNDAKASPEACATDKRTANRPKAEPKSVIDLISEAKIEECFKQKFIDLLKAEFIDSKPKEFTLMLKSMKAQGILKPSDNIVYYEAFEAYFGKKYGTTEAKNKTLRAKYDERVLDYKQRITNIINKSKTI